MGTVVEPTDTTLGRKVAIKFVRRAGNDHSEERLRREAVATQPEHSSFEHLKAPAVGRKRHAPSFFPGQSASFVHWSCAVWQ
mgnify:CR=1 FL=1